MYRVQQKQVFFVVVVLLFRIFEAQLAVVWNTNSRAVAVVSEC